MHRLLLSLGLLVTLGVATPSFARDRASDEGVRFIEIADQLDLSPTQRTALEEVVYRSKSARVDIRARLTKGELDLKHALVSGALDEKAVRAASETVSAATADLIHNRVDQIVAIRKQLTPDQWDKLKTLWAESRRADGQEDDE